MTNDKRKLLKQAKKDACGQTSVAGKFLDGQTSVAGKFLDLCRQTERFRSINIWERLDDNRLACYHCFEVLETGRPPLGFCVQSRDIYYLEGIPFLYLFQRQFLELLIKEAPHVRNGLFSTLEAAIAAYNKSLKTGG